MQKNIKFLQTWRKEIAISFFLVLVFLSGTGMGFPKEKVTQTKVLGANTHVIPSPTPSPIPTTVPVTIINNIYVPTQPPVVLAPTSTPSIYQSTPTTTPTPVVQPNSTPTPTPTTILSPTPTPTPVPQSVEIDIDYAGAHTSSDYTVSITPGETAWQAVQDAIGIANMTYTDYGGDLGIFITGFNGVATAANQYYDFQINGTSASVGVSAYVVVNHDVLKFVLTNF